MPAELEIATASDDRPIVVCAVPLKAPARARLERALGNVRLVDIRVPVEGAAVVLSPPCSPQTIARLKSAHPGARLIVVELEDDEMDIDLAGPVTRSRRAGADGYLAASSIDDLAWQLTTRDRTEVAPELTGDATAEVTADVTALPAADALDDLIMRRVEEMLRDRIPHAD